MAEPDAGGGRPSRPLVERIGLFGLALVFCAVFVVLAAASYASGEIFLALLGALGAAMTLWAGLMTLVRG